MKKIPNSFQVIGENKKLTHKKLTHNSRILSLNRKLHSSIYSKLILLFLIMLASQLFAGQELPNGCQVAVQLDFGNQSATPTGVEQNWKSLSLIGLLVSSVLLSVMYMIGKALNAAQLLSRVKTDLIQVVVTGFLLLFLYSIFSFICLLDAREFGFSFSSFFDGARNYFEYARGSALSSYLSITNSMMLISGLSSMSINNPNFLDFGNYLKIGVYFKPFAGYGISLVALNWFASLVMLSYSLITGFLVVLDAIQVYFLNLLLPAGVVLRCFSPTRDFGGVLISISVGLFVFYPVLFSFSYMVIGQPDPNVDLPDMDWEGKITGEVAKIIGMSTIPLGNVYTVINSLLGDGDKALDKLMDAYGSVGNIILYVYILPAINWIILIALIRELSKAFGQEVDISGLARMI